MGRHRRGVASGSKTGRAVWESNQSVLGRSGGRNHGETDSEPAGCHDGDRGLIRKGSAPFFFPCQRPQINSAAAAVKMASGFGKVVELSFLLDKGGVGLDL